MTMTTLDLAPLNKTTKVLIKLSKTKKMPCLSWSLPALSTCPGSRDKRGNLVPVCQGCYATTGFYQMKAAKDVREHNRKDWMRADWWTDMVDALEGEEYFRWFDSGDVYSETLAHRIFLVMQATPNTKHWLPTRSYKVPRIKRWLTKMKRLPNVMVRHSADRINYFNKKLHGSMVIDKSSLTYLGFEGTRGWGITVYECPAYIQNGECRDCRACWDKRIRVIGYPAHGQKMASVLTK